MQILSYYWVERNIFWMSSPTGYDDGSSIVDICTSAQSGQHKWSWDETGKMIAQLWIFEPYSDAWSIHCVRVGWVFLFYPSFQSRFI